MNTYENVPVKTGVVRVTSEVRAVLTAFFDAEESELYGWAVIERTLLYDTTVYRILQRLVDAGVLAERKEYWNTPDKRPRLHFYRLTAYGAAWTQDLLAER